MLQDVIESKGQNGVLNYRVYLFLCQSEVLSDFLRVFAKLAESR